MHYKESRLNHGGKYISIAKIIALISLIYPSIPFVEVPELAPNFRFRWQKKVK